MKNLKLVIVTIVMLLAGCATLNNLFTGSDEKPRWPVTVVSWDDALTRTDAAEVVIVCLVDEYDQRSLTPSNQGGGPSLFGPPRRNEVTPAQVLQSYLRGVRSLDENAMMTSAGEPDSKKMAIFIVASGDQTREKATELFTKFGVRYYDRSIPVIYVFHNKQLITSYTYFRDPGGKGAKLKSVVHDLFKIP